MGRVAMQGMGSQPLTVLGLVLLCLAGGCTTRRGRARIQAEDPADRVRAIIQAVEESDGQAVPLIIDRLDDEDEAVRTVAAIALRKLTDQDFGYRPYDSLHRRTEAIGRWRKWWAESKMKAPTTRPGRSHPAEQVDK